MPARISFWALLLLSPFCGPNFAGAAELGWKPEKTWLFVVGILSWKHSNLYGSANRAFFTWRDDLRVVPN